MSHTHTLCASLPQGSRRDQDEGGGAGPSSQPRRHHEQGGGAGLQKLDFFCFRLFLNSSAMDIVFCSSTAVETAIVQCTSRWAIARGHRLDTSIVLVVPRSLQSFSGGICGSAFTLSSPSPLSLSLIRKLASVDVKQYGQFACCVLS